MVIMEIRFTDGTIKRGVRADYCIFEDNKLMYTETRDDTLSRKFIILNNVSKIEVIEGASWN